MCILSECWSRDDRSAIREDPPQDGIALRSAVEKKDIRFVTVLEVRSLAIEHGLGRAVLRDDLAEMSTQLGDDGGRREVRVPDKGEIQVGQVPVSAPSSFQGRSPRAGVELRISRTSSRWDRPLRPTDIARVPGVNGRSSHIDQYAQQELVVAIGINGACVEMSSSCAKVDRANSLSNL